MKKYTKWFVISLIVFMVSLFLHECGHGIANCLAGISCSTGFNRIGDIYKYPSDEDFRAFYDTTEPVFWDYGVPCTLILSVVGAVLFSKAGNNKLRYMGASLAAGNGLLRFIPCLMVLLIPAFTGNAHIEDEYETGQLLVKMTGSAFWLYIPALFSAMISALSLVWVLRTAIKRKISNILIYSGIALLVFCVGMILASVLDQYIRINWIVV